VAYNAAGLTMTHFASVTHQFDNSYTGPAGAELMSYCSPLGLGSWFWETARNGLVPTASASTASLSADMAIQSNNQSLTPDMRRNVLLITGKKTSEGYTMNPVMTVKSIPTDAYSLLNTRDPKTEWLTVEFVNKKNTVIFTTKIDVTKFEDIDTEEAIFGATTDMPSEPLSAIVLKDSTGKEVARVTDKPHTQAPTISYIDRTSKFIHTGTSQMVMVQDPETFEVLSMVQGEGQMHRFNHKEGQKFNILTSTGLTTTQTVGQ